MVFRPPAAVRPVGAPGSVVLLIALFVAACSTSGRELEPPSTPAAAPTPTVAATVPVEPLVTGVGGFSVSLRDLTPGEAIPAEYTLGGGNEIPPLAWASAPSATAEFAITLQDFDLDGQVRWLLVGVPGSEPGLVGGLLPVGSRGVISDLGIADYQGPAAPLGETHRFVFTIYALDRPLNVAEGATFAEVLEQIGQFALATTSITATHTG